MNLFRGMNDRGVMNTFITEGGTELAPMSTTAELWVALQYCMDGASGSTNTLLWIRSKNFMVRGVDLEWLSAFPHEKEYLYPPLAFLQPSNAEPITLDVGDSTLKVVELEITI